MASKNQTIQIRVTDLEKATIQQAAQQADMDMSAWALNKLLPNRQNQFQELARALAEQAQNRRYLFAELNDLLSQMDSVELSTIMTTPLSCTLDEYTSNYLAAMLETTAHKLKLPVTGWILKIPPLQNPEFGSELLSLRLHLLTHSPPAFRRRNIFIDASIGDRV